MKEFCENLGVLIITAVMLAVPILCAISFAFDWGFDAKIFFTFLSMIDYIVTLWCVIVTIDKMGE